MGSGIGLASPNPNPNPDPNPAPDPSPHPRAHQVPLLLEALCKQEDDAEDSWNLAMAAATCLARVARVSQDLVVQVPG